MEEHNHDHEELIKELSEEFHTILSHSDQAIYLYLDDNHKICNEKYAKMLGYPSVEDWAAEEVFLDKFVEKSSQEKLVKAYQAAMEQFVGASFEVTWKKKDGGSVATKVILVPITFGGELLALHFISEI